MARKIKEKNRLYELKGSGYEIAEGEPDIRGWKVKNLQGRTLGEVEELLFDVESYKVRYLIINLDGKPLNLVSRKIIMPIGVAELHEEGDDVILPTVTVGHLATLPTYKRGKITNETERTIRSVFSDSGTTLTDTSGDEFNREDFYNHDHFDEDRFYRKRSKSRDVNTVYPLEQERTQTYDDNTTIPIIQENEQIRKRDVEKGGARIRKSNVEQPIQNPGNLKKENVVVDQNKVNKSADDDSFGAFQEGSIEFTERAEVPVVSKEARVVEEISVGKEVTQREETVRDSVRKTEVDIDQYDNKDDKNEVRNT
jgi:stress response protein YsnF